MSEKHTPGPWKFDVADDCDDFSFSRCMIYDSSGGAVAETYAHTNMPTLEANACLIAAAPDLLEACCKLLHVVGQIELGSPLISEGHSAAKFARAVMHSLLDGISDLGDDAREAFPEEAVEATNAAIAKAGGESLVDD